MLTIPRSCPRLAPEEVHDTDSLAGANEYFSGFASIGHNAAWDLFWLWILPNGLWIIFPGYIAYLLGDELVNALEGASGNEKED